MGYKTATVFVTSAEPNYFSTNPEHLPGKAAELIDMLCLGHSTAGQMATYLDAMYPPKGEFALGAYENGFILADQRLFGLIDEKHHEIRQRIVECFPSAHMLGIVLHSVVNLFGYALYANGSLVRALAGSSDSGCILDVGEHQPEEEIWPYELEFTDAIDGESLIFAMAAHFLGRHLDEWIEPDPGPLLQLFTR